MRHLCALCVRPVLAKFTKKSQSSQRLVASWEIIKNLSVLRATFAALCVELVLAKFAKKSQSSQRLVALREIIKNLSALCATFAALCVRPVLAKLIKKSQSSLDHSFYFLMPETLHQMVIY